MTLITIGKTGKEQVQLDIQRLLVSRMLVTGTSGSGKSWAVRKIIEMVSATTQTIVLDPEGEFSSLREIRDVALIGPDGDAPADPRYAARLAKDLMSFRISAVIDIQELSSVKRREFVANFCHAMVDLPRNLWRPCVVVLDEAHEFAPNSKDKSFVSGEAVSLLFSKGRKRGFCPVVATTRLAMLSMDVAAEAKNRLVGNAVLDVDQKRAADFLGFGKDRWPELRDMSPVGREGEFFAVGPAFTHRGVQKMRIGEVTSTHPKAGEGRIAEPPEPSAKMQKVLAELKNLPQKAEEEIKDLKEANRQISELKKQLKTAEKQAPQVDSLRQIQRVVEQQVVYQQAISKQEVDKLHGTLTQYKREIDNSRAGLVGIYSDLNSSVEQLLTTLAKAEIRPSPLPPATRAPVNGQAAKKVLPKLDRHQAPPPAPHQPEAQVSRRREPDGNTTRSSGIWEIVNACLQNPEGLSRQEIKVITGYRRTSIQTYVPQAISAGYLEQRGTQLVATGEGLTELKARGLYRELPTGHALLEHHLQNGQLPEGEQKILKVVADSHPNGVRRKDLPDLTGYQRTSIQTYVPKLKSRGLVVDVNGELKLHERLTEYTSV